MTDHSTPILLNHDHTKVIGVFEDGVASFLPDHRPTREELLSIFGNVGYRPMETFIDRHGVKRFAAVEILEFSLSPAAPDNGRAAP